MIEITYESKRLTDTFLVFFGQYARRQSSTNGRFWRPIAAWEARERRRRAELAAAQHAGHFFDTPPAPLEIPEMDLKWLKFAMVQLWNLQVLIGNTWLSPDKDGNFIHPALVMPTVEFVEAIRAAIFDRWLQLAGPTSGKLPN